MKPRLPARSEHTVPAEPTRPGPAQLNLDWPALKRLHGWRPGPYLGLMRGSGLDLADLREYQPHDEVRHIDGYATARLQTPHVRLFHEERDMSAWFVLDQSGSMQFGSGHLSKAALAHSLVWGLATAWLRQGHRVGALTFDEHSPQGLSQSPRALGGRQGAAQLRHALSRVPGSAQSSAPLGEAKRAQSLARALHRAGATLHRRSTVLVLSDFQEQTDWEPALGRLAQRHDVVAMQLLDPLEQDMPDLGLLHLQDAESGATLWVDSRDRTLRKRFAQAAAEREAHLREAFGRAGVDALVLSTAADWVAELRRFVRLRSGLPAQAGPRLAEAAA